MENFVRRVKFCLWGELDFQAKEIMGTKKNSGCLLIVIGVGDSLDLCINQLLVEVGGMEYLVGQPPRISGLKGVKSI